jgi:hypothetical protein
MCKLNKWRVIAHQFNNATLKFQISRERLIRISQAAAKMELGICAIDEIAH